MLGIRITLRVGAIVFGLSAVLLLVAPSVFLNLLLLDGSSDALQWAMRMIGLTLVALAANMWLVSYAAGTTAVTRAGIVMAIVATALGIVTLAIPADRSWFTLSYASIGFAFGITYVILLIRDARRTSSGAAPSVKDS